MTPTLHSHAQACGKVIVMGEHAVVYGYPALAAGVPAGVVLHATRLAENDAPIRLRIPAWDLDLSLSADAEHPVARAALEVLGFCDGPIRGWEIVGEGELPPGAGLGSSAALTVALARLALGPGAAIDTVVQASMHGERIFHGEPSGIDSEVAARGGLLRFVRGEPPEAITAGPGLRLLVVPSGIERRTAAQVAEVRRRHDRYREVIRPTLEALGQATAACIAAVERSDFETLGEMFTIAHGLLGAIGVSSPALDELCSTALCHGALGAKLTGAGGGGCILCVPPPEPRRLVAAFEARGLRPLLIELAA